MGSPLGPTLANIFMSVLETKFMANCPFGFKPILYRRYVDDTYCLFEKVEHVEKFLAYLNGQHLNIKFTYEIEEDNSLPFLDVLVTWDGSDFVTDLFRKKTFTGLYTDFGSLTTSNYKTNLITVLVYRAFHICSTYISFHTQLLFIKEVLHDNCYPKYLIDSFIKRFLNKHFDPRLEPTTVQKMPLCFYITYLGQISLQLRRKISRLLRKAYPCVDFRVVFRSGRHIEHFFPFKDRIPKNVCSHVVFKYSCSGCQACYIGKTSRHLLIRSREHLGIGKKGQPIKTSPSAISEHIKQTGHCANLENFTILEKANNEHDLLIFESLLILRDRPSLNAKNSSIPLVLF